ncbi:MAG TPA: alpha/beta fold hydrolase [Planctomycetaceae bacterium]|jgi:dienelactone hydrolase|nr:alpha/beta fold hydrolase [Planctomycetaceae bacterium]
MHFRQFTAQRARLVLLVLALSGGMGAMKSATADEPPLPPIRTLQTAGGIPFAILGDKPAAPGPTLFVFASEMRTTLTNEDGGRLGHLLARKGFLCVSLDLPCHGADVRPGENPSDLRGWRTRLEEGENFVATFAAKVSQVLDHLIAEKYTDPDSVGVAGTSRGGFIALHCAAVDSRLKYVVAFAPVTHLPALTEFAGTDKSEPVLALSVSRAADKLVGRPIWMVIGNNDVRVGTEHCLTLLQELVKKSAATVTPVPVELHLVGTINHRLHASPAPQWKQTYAPHAEAAEWYLAQVGKK